MERVLEAELMDDPEQALAYARADFHEENQGFANRLLEFYPELLELKDAHVLDLGCGPADIPIRLARAWPTCRITGVDGSSPMIALGLEAVRAAGLSDRITLRCERMQDTVLAEKADVVISNSLLHHLPNPLQFWYAIRQLAKPGAVVLVMDLLRPDSPEAAQALVDRYASQEPARLRRDFYQSLLAAFTDDDVAAQLTEMNMSRLLIDVPDDRHWLVGGRLV